jgi:hypothetical protein
MWAPVLPAHLNEEAWGIVDGAIKVADEEMREAVETIRARADEVRAEDWGRSNRSKRPWLMGMEAARKAIDPEVGSARP